MKKRTTEEILREIQNEIGITGDTWNDRDGIERRKKLIQEVETLGRGITKILDEPTEKKKKAERINKFLKGSQYVSLFLGVIGLLKHSYFDTPSLGDFVTGAQRTVEFHPGGTFWLEIAVFIFVIRIILKIVKFGMSIDTSGISKTWNNVKEYVRTKAGMNEGFVSYEEFAMLEEIKITI